MVDDVKVQGSVQQRALIHKWLVITRGKQWGYELNAQPGKTITVLYIEGKKSDIVKGLNGRALLQQQQEPASPKTSAYEAVNREQREKNKAIWEALKEGRSQSEVLEAVAAKALAKEQSTESKRVTTSESNIQGIAPGTTTVRVKKQPVPHTNMCDATATVRSARGRKRTQTKMHIYTMVPIGIRRSRQAAVTNAAV